MGFANRQNTNDLRRDIRFATSFRAELVDAGKLVSVTVGNISEGGALLIGNRLPLLGARVVLKTENLDLTGRVIWRREDLAGINFEQRVNPLCIVRANTDHFQAYRERRAARNSEFENPILP